MFVWFAGWQLRPWARLCLRFRRGGNVAVWDREALPDIPGFPVAARQALQDIADFPEATPRLAAEAQRWVLGPFQVPDGVASASGWVVLAAPAARHSSTIIMAASGDGPTTQAITDIPITAIPG